MKKQYNIRQEELMKENNALRKVVHDQGDAIRMNFFSPKTCLTYHLLDEKEQRIVDLKREKEYDLMQKDEEIRELKRKIEDMSSEFANMLRVNEQFILLEFNIFFIANPRQNARENRIGKLGG